MRKAILSARLLLITVLFFSMSSACQTEEAVVLQKLREFDVVLKEVKISDSVRIKDLTGIYGDSVLTAESEDSMIISVEFDLTKDGKTFSRDDANFIEVENTTLTDSDGNDYGPNYVRMSSESAEDQVGEEDLVLLVNVNVVFIVPKESSWSSLKVEEEVINVSKMKSNTLEEIVFQ